MRTHRFVDRISAIFVSYYHQLIVYAKHNKSYTMNALHSLRNDVQQKKKNNAFQ